jgi:glycine C-acetyltransferase/8-amino-7-oxononanoate synthase
VLDGDEVLLLCSNNYLGLADHPEVVEAAQAATERWGAGAGGSRLISGNMSPHRRFESALAKFHGHDAALLFGSGYLANTGTIAALARHGEVVLSDALNHASIIDGCRLAGAETFVYEHADTDHLEWGLREHGRRASLIVTDGLFSMDGDIAPLAKLAELAERYDCRLMVDEAHAIGTIGPQGRGTVADAGLTEQVDVVVGTLGKALGSYGAYVCASAEVVDLLVNTARPFIFSTALGPPAIGAAAAALELVISEPERIERLQRNAFLLRQALADTGFDVARRGAHIVPLPVGEASAAVKLCDAALERGVFAQAIRPPTVPDQTSRLRLSVMSVHRRAELRDAASVLAEAARESGASDRTGRFSRAIEIFDDDSADDRLDIQRAA